MHRGCPCETKSLQFVPDRKRQLPSPLAQELNPAIYLYPAVRGPADPPAAPSNSLGSHYSYRRTSSILNTALLCLPNTNVIGDSRNPGYHPDAARRRPRRNNTINPPLSQLPVVRPRQFSVHCAAMATATIDGTGGKSCCCFCAPPDEADEDFLHSVGERGMELIQAQRVAGMSLWQSWEVVEACRDGVEHVGFRVSMGDAFVCSRWAGVTPRKTGCMFCPIRELGRFASWLAHS